MLKTEMRNEKSMHLDKMETLAFLRLMNDENKNAVMAVEGCLETLAVVIDEISRRYARGGRLFYMGAGTSGRLGVVDASECPPTFGVGYDRVIGILAGGRDAMFRASEGGEDSEENAVNDLKQYSLSENDCLVGISAAGGAAYVVAGLRYAAQQGCYTVALTSNPNTSIEKEAAITLLTDTGAEVLTGSTRLKAGTAQKLILNMISTGVMVKNGYVCENLMINLKPTNKKLRERMIGIVYELLPVDREEAERLLEQAGWSIREAVEAFPDIR